MHRSLVSPRLTTALIQSGFYPALIRVERISTEQDAYGALVESGAPTILYDELPATIGRASAGEIERFELETYQPVAAIECSERIEIDAHDRVVDQDGTTYDVLAIIQDSQSVRTKLLVREGA
ncbi:MAG: hypothetical protein A3J75_06535 [Acidobacteria bacterium RBG_16_68_9]|nr:MAG: hypothetical protein A3J75_06535 [Acidobacteria bacterium RBG_16_68_9]